MPEIARPTPLAALDGAPTPTELHFVRSHFGTPDVDARAWTLDVAGAVARPFSVSLAELRELGSHTVRAVLECAGHRRAELVPPAEGVAWRAGAVSQAEWAGAPLRDLLARSGAAAEGMEVALHGKETFARSIPLAKALDPDTLVAWAIGGEPIPRELGGPVRAIVPGRYAVDSVKWLRTIEVRVEPFDGPFQVHDYRIFDAAGVPDGEPLGELPVTSLVTWPEDRGILRTGRTVVRGLAWGGEGGAVAVTVRLDGEEEVPATLTPPAGPYAFTPWEATLDLSPGEHVLAARAVDAAGRAQPDGPLWNRRGYANSSVHRVRVRVAA
ncbi:MAG: sulfite oxidase [Actinomycetota bacterium]|nr:sulfite oxidase [Actinomycetota bacterium]